MSVKEEAFVCLGIVKNALMLFLDVALYLGNVNVKLTAIMIICIGHLPFKAILQYISYRDRLCGATLGSILYFV